MVLRWCWLSN